MPALSTMAKQSALVRLRSISGHTTFLPLLASRKSSRRSCSSHVYPSTQTSPGRPAASAKDLALRPLRQGALRNRPFRYRFRLKTSMTEAPYFSSRTDRHRVAEPALTVRTKTVIIFVFLFDPGAENNDFFARILSREQAWLPRPKRRRRKNAKRYAYAQYGPSPTGAGSRSCIWPAMKPTSSRLANTRAKTSSTGYRPLVSSATYIPNRGFWNESSRISSQSGV